MAIQLRPHTHTHTMAMAGKQPKAMSSRLATMKFMQRSSSAAAGSGDVSSEPSPKRQRLSTGSHAAASPAATPSRINPNSQIDGEWYLSYKAPSSAAAATTTTAQQSPFRVVTAGYSFLDTPEQRKSARTEAERRGGEEDEEDESEAEVVTGRMNFGKFGQKQEKKKKHGSDSEDLSDSDEEDDEEGGGGSANATSVDALINQGRKDAAERIRAERKAKRHADSAELRQAGGERRKKDVKLNRLSGISSGGGGGGHGGSPLTGGGGGASNASCYTCGKRGHMKKDCPKAASAGSKGRKSF